MYATYFIPRENEASFTTRLGKLACKAIKLGLTPITFDAVKVFPLERTRYRLAMDEYGNEITKAYQVTLEHVAYTVRGEAPTLEGWGFVGTLEHVEGHTILRTLIEEALPERFRTATPEHCDHCNTRRRRNDTFIVRHAESGEFKQVGRNCLKDFLGNANPAEVAAFATLLLDLQQAIGGYCEEDGAYGNGTVVETFPLVDFLAVTAAAIHEFGWTSRSNAKESGGSPTADLVLSHLDARRNPHLSRKDREARTIPGADAEGNFEVAEEALAWAKAQDATGNDYIHNLQVIIEVGYVTDRTAGYAASIVSSFYRAQERKLYNEGLKATGTEHIGEVGKRQDMVLTLLAVHSFDGLYGTNYIHKFMDDAGNAVTWFASNDEVVPCSDAYPHPFFKEWNVHGDVRKAPMIKGATYRVKATVKKHDSYQGQNQTVVTRVAVQPLVKKPRKRRKKAEGQLELVQ